MKVTKEVESTICNTNQDEDGEMERYWEVKEMGNEVQVLSDKRAREAAASW